MLMLAAVALAANASCAFQSRPIVVVGLAIDDARVASDPRLEAARADREAALAERRYLLENGEVPDAVPIDRDTWSALAAERGAVGRFATLQLAADLADSRFAGDLDEARALLAGRRDAASRLLDAELAYRAGLPWSGTCDDVLLPGARTRSGPPASVDELAQQRQAWKRASGRTREVLALRLARWLPAEEATALRETVAGPKMPDRATGWQEVAAVDVERHALAAGDLAACVATLPDDAWFGVRVSVEGGRFAGADFEGHPPVCLSPALVASQLGASSGAADLWLVRLTLAP